MEIVSAECGNCREPCNVAENFLGKNATCEKCGTIFTLAPRTLFGDFVVEAKLGEGGMGTVVLVRSKTTGHRFAVKRTKLQDEKSRPMDMSGQYDDRAVSPLRNTSA